MIDPDLHLLCGFLVNPSSFPCFLHDKIGNPHNGEMTTAQECRRQSVVHNLVIAAPKQNALTEAREHITLAFAC